MKKLLCILALSALVPTLAFAWGEGAKRAGAERGDDPPASMTCRGGVCKKTMRSPSQRRQYGMKQPRQGEKREKKRTKSMKQAKTRTRGGMVPTAS